MNNAQQGGLGALLSGFSGGVMGARQLQAGMQEQKNTTYGNGSGTALLDAAAQPGSFGLPGTMAQQSPTGALGLPPAAPMTSTPQNKAADTQGGGNWKTIANFYSPQSGQQA